MGSSASVDCGVTSSSKKRRNATIIKKINDDGESTVSEYTQDEQDMARNNCKRT